MCFCLCVLCLSPGLFVARFVYVHLPLLAFACVETKKASWTPIGVRFVMLPESAAFRTQDFPGTEEQVRKRRLRVMAQSPN